jgi:rubrerythrin
VGELGDRVDRMALLVEAMWELLARDGHSEDELAQMIEEIVARRTAASTVCRECGARVTGSNRCQICGAETGAPGPPALEGL